MSNPEMTPGATPVPEIGVDELAAALAAGGRLFDVRETVEYAAGHVPGAAHIPLGEVPTQVDSFRGEGPAHIICQSGGRSMRAAEYLSRFGIPAVNVAGGTGAWANSGRPIIAGDSPS